MEHGVYVTKDRKKRAFLHFITNVWEDRTQFRSEQRENNCEKILLRHFFYLRVLDKIRYLKRKLPTENKICNLGAYKDLITIIDVSLAHLLIRRTLLKHLKMILIM